MSASSSDVPAAISEAADRLETAAAKGVPCRPVAPLIAAFGIDGAYRVQHEVTRRRLAQGGRVVGRKIGLTSPAVQRQLGVDQPDYGALFADMAFGDRDEIPTGRLLQPRIEGEVAFVLERDLDAPATVADVIRATAFVVPALEVVDSRIADWAIAIVDTVADNASSGLFVLGATPQRLEALDLGLAGMALEHGGEPVSVGCGAACLGHPVNAVLWLARRMVDLGTPLLAGDVVLSGALGPMAPVVSGGSYRLRINGLGSVTAAFAPEAA